MRASIFKPKQSTSHKLLNAIIKFVRTSLELLNNFLRLQLLERLIDFIDDGLDLKQTENNNQLDLA